MTAPLTRDAFAGQLLALYKDVREGRDMDEVIEELEELLGVDVEDDDDDDDDL